MHSIYKYYWQQKGAGARVLDTIATMAIFEM